jgi:DNA-binding transcriptional MocR family regulator
VKTTEEQRNRDESLEPPEGLQAKTPVFRYQQLAGELEHQILNGTYRVGDRLPSIRKLRRRLNLSISTVFKAFAALEAIGLVEARSKSGYYVTGEGLRQLVPPAFETKSSIPRKVNLTGMVASILSAMSDPRMLPLGSSAISTDLLPYKAISRILKNLSAQELKAQFGYSLAEGDPGLRRQLAGRMGGWGKAPDPAGIVVTNGCSEALMLALRAASAPGDTIAVETPTHFGLLQLLSSLGVTVVEVPTDPRTGLKVDALENILSRHAIGACVVIPNFHNPSGSLMADEEKERLVRLLNRRNIPLIEDEIYADLHYGPNRPIPLRAFDRKDMVITCGSFSKTLVPGLRIGWVVPGTRFLDKVKELKAGLNVSTATLNQHIVATYLADMSYDRHLRALRRQLKSQTFNIAEAIRKCFPEGTRLCLPQGGALLWVQLPTRISGSDLYLRALEHHISILPGRACAIGEGFESFIRIGCGYPFTERVQSGIATLGRLAEALSS